MAKVAAAAEKASTTGEESLLDWVAWSHDQSSLLSSRNATPVSGKISSGHRHQCMLTFCSFAMAGRDLALLVGAMTKQAAQINEILQSSNKYFVTLQVSYSRRTVVEV